MFIELDLRVSLHPQEVLKHLKEERNASGKIKSYV